MTHVHQPGKSEAHPGASEATPRRWKAWLGLVVAVVVLWLIVSGVSVFRVVRRIGLLAGSGTAVTISRETTRIVEPLRDDGYVDYLAALNQRSRQGVTPENNAAVLLWQALGPAEIVGTCGEEGCDWHFQELGIPRPPEQGEYFVALQNYAIELEADGPPPEQEASQEEPELESQVSRTWGAILSEQSEQAARRPWAPEEFPELAAWLEKNQQPLALVVEASRRERFYSPLVPAESPPVLGALTPGRYLFRDACSALRIRAMLHVHDGKVDEAWHDLLACHRWARLVGQGPTYIEVLVAKGIDGTACAGDAAVAHHGNLTSERARRFQADLRQLGALPGVVDKIDVAERFMFLDSVSAMAREGPAAFAESAGSDEAPSWLETQLSKRATRLLDWDEVLRTGNNYFDRLVEAGRIADRSEREEAVAELNEEIEEGINEIRDPMSLAKSFLGKGPGEAVTEKIGQVFFALWGPTLSTAWRSEDRAELTLQMAQVSLALAAYRGDHGSYPDELAQLVPEYLDEVPRDVYADGELRYERDGEDYVLYGVGLNGQDEEGRDYECDPSGDDVAIRTALPP
ncbi:MAG TPA: hypothetical protein VMY37_40965 [Thermoguttaceae bacterium]|nr:hypothetical protein [Thermoguttaceae bacterium]